MNQVIEAMYFDGKSVTEVMEATGLNFGVVRAEFASLNHFRHQYMENMSQNRLLQIGAIESALFQAIEEYKRTPTPEGRKKVHELQNTYCRFSL